MQYKNPEKLLSIVEADESDLTVSGLVKPDILQARRLQLVVFYSEAQTSEQDKFGYQVSFQFWAWGDDERETMDNSGLAVQTMLKCLKLLSAELNQRKANGEVTHAETSVPQ